MFRRFLFLFLLFALGAGAAHAQTSLPSETFKQRLRGQHLHNDTVQAIISLYSRRQAGGASWIVAAALASVRVATAPAPNTTNGSGIPARTESNAGVAALAALPFVGYGVAKIVRYSNANLETLLTGYAAGQPLPRAIRRKLKPRFFNQPIIKYQNVPVQPAK